MRKKPFNGTQLRYRNRRQFPPCLNLPHLLYYPVQSFHSVLMTYRMQITYNPTMRFCWQISGLVSNDCQPLLICVDLTSICYLATMVDGPHAAIIQPYALRAPEVILGSSWDTSADIWNLGCLVSRSSFQLPNKFIVVLQHDWRRQSLVIWVSHWKMALYPTERTHVERWKLPSCSYAYHCRGRFRSHIRPEGETFWKIFYVWRLVISLMITTEKY